MKSATLATLGSTIGHGIRDAVRRGRATRPKPFDAPYAEARTKVVIAGGGFGGLAALRFLARSLEGREGVGAILVDRVNFSTFWPLVPATISGDVELQHAVYPIRRATNPLGASFSQAAVEGVDFESRTVGTDRGPLSYDYLILAPGSRTTFFGTPGARENALDLKGLGNALGVRNTVIDRFEEADWLRGDYADDLLTFVFVGGGATGVEAAADTHDLIFEALADDYPNVDLDRVRLVLVNAGKGILKGLDPSLANAGARRFATKRIEVLNDAKVTEVTPDAVALSDGRTLRSRTVVWAAGVEPPPLVRDMDVAKDPRGRILVDGFLRVKDRPGVYAVGDCVHLEYDGPEVPALAQAAEQEGAVAGRNLAAEILGKEVKEAFRYRQLGQLIDLGYGGALVDITGAKFAGAIGAVVWKGVYLYELGHNINRARVLADWVLDLVSRPDTSKLFAVAPTKDDRSQDEEGQGNGVSG